MNGLRTAFLTLHVAGGLTGLLLGVFVLRPPEPPTFRLTLRRTYAAAIAVLVVFLIGLVAIDWARIDATPRIIFSALVALGLLIAARLYLAFRLAAERPSGWQPRYMNHVFFSYISLWEGFFIVGLIDLNAPGWLVAVVAVGVLLVGGFLFNRFKDGLTGAPQLTT